MTWPFFHRWSGRYFRHCQCKMRFVFNKQKQRSLQDKCRTPSKRPNRELESWSELFSQFLWIVIQRPMHIIKRLLHLCPDICTLSSAEWYCAHKVEQYRRSELVHISQWKLNALYVYVRSISGYPRFHFYYSAFIDHVIRYITRVSIGKVARPFLLYFLTRPRM